MEALLAASKAKDPDLATSAVIALGRARAPEAVAVLTRLAVAKDVDTTVRESAILALGLIGLTTDTRTFLIERAKAEDATERERGFALLALGIRGDVATVPHLLRTATEESGPDRRRATAAFVAGRAGRAGTPELVRLVETREVPELVRAHAAAGLAESPDPVRRFLLLRALSSDCAPLRCQAALSLGAVSEADVPAVRESLEKLLDSGAPPPLAPFAAIALGEIGAAESLRALRRAYRRGDARLAAHAALAIGLLARNTEDDDVRRKARVLLRAQLLEFADSDLSAALALATATAGDGKVAARLRELLNGEKDPEVRGHVAVALGILGVREVAPDLRKILTAAKDPALLRETALALDLLVDREAKKILIRHLRESDSLAVRGAAATAAGRLRSPEAARALLDILVNADRTPVVRAFAAVGLGLHLETDPLLATLGARLHYPMVGGALREALTFF